MSQINTNTIKDASGGNTATINGMTPTGDSLQGFRNRIINGAMVIDQRNAGASGSSNTYTVDRWQLASNVSGKLTWQQNQGSVTPPVGFSNYLGFTSSSSYSVGASEYFYINQNIEGYNWYDLNWGSANAKTVTLSFWVRSSLTGTFGGALVNWAGNYSYPFSYTISAANTWEYKTITIAGPTAGTWAGATNAGALQIYISLGTGTTLSGTAGSWSANLYGSATGATSVVGTNGATFYITGVQLEAGSVATPFERRPYGTELALCQRYYYRLKASAANKIFSASGQCYSTTSALAIVQFPVTMRTEPSALEQSGTASDYRIWNSTANAVSLTAVPTFSSGTASTTVIDCTVASGITAGNATGLLSSTSNAYLGWSAEL